MIECKKCNKKLFSIADVENVKTIGMALYGNCKKCGERQSVAGLWRRTKVQKWTPLPKERKKKHD